MLLVKHQENNYWLETLYRGFMSLYALRILRSQPLRLALTVGGIALCVVLMLFLLSAYNGVSDGSVDYIRKNNADLWVLQRNAWNILRGSSMLPSEYSKVIGNTAGVQSVAPVLLILSAIQKDNRTATVFLTGFEPEKKLGGPPHLAEGRSVSNDDEIVLDRAFARKFHLKVGDTVKLQDYDMKIVGISTGTNAFVIQYAFTTMRRAQSLIGLSGIVTCYLVKLNVGGNGERVAKTIRSALPAVEVYEHTQFLQNNIREMQSGLLPFLYTVAALGVIVLMAILSLLLSVNILERRKDFAVLKTLGSPSSFLSRLIVEQALLISFLGMKTGLTLFYPMVVLLERISPEVTTKSSVEQVMGVVAVVIVVSLMSSFISLQRLRRIYPMEAF